MDSPVEEPATPARRRFRRALVALLSLLCVLEVVYVVAGLFLVKSGQVGRWINKHPEKLRITFDSVWPIVPGMVRIRGFRMVNQGRGDQLEGTVDRVWGAINPLELPAGRLHIVWLRATGVTFRLRNRPATAAEAASFPVSLPPIEGVAWEPFAGAPPGLDKKKKDGLTIVFTRSRLDDVRDVWLFDRRVRGPGTVVASVTVHGDGRIAIPHADVRFEGARIENGKDETYSGIRVRVLGEMAAFGSDETNDAALLALIRARVDLEARMPSGAAYLNAFLHNAPWIRFGGGEAGLAAHLSVGAGRLAPGGYLELSAHELQADFAGFTARGKARTRLDVVSTDGEGGDAKLVVAFDQYELRRRKEDPEPVLRGRGLRIAATTPGSLAAIPPTEFSGRVELGRAEFPRLDFVNELFAGGGDLQLRGGAAKVVGAFDVAGSGSSCKGSMKVTAEGLSVDAGGVAMTGAFSLVLSVPNGDFLKRSFDVDGTRLTLDRFSFASRHEAASAADWSARVDFPKAHLQLGDAFAFRGHVDHFASDSRPVVTLLSNNEPLAGWKKKLVTVGEIKGGGLFALSGGSVAVSDYSVGWGSVEVKARFRTTAKGANGKALVRVGVLKAGIGLEEGKRKLHVLRPGSWYEER